MQMKMRIWQYFDYYYIIFLYMLKNTHETQTQSHI